jgi:alkyldihydroxyacetonephosphate synthase
MRWWGWGEDARATRLPDAARTLVREAFRLSEEELPARVALEDVRLPEPALPTSLRERVAEAVGQQNVAADRLARVSHAVGRSYPDLVRIRSGDGSSAPDAVVYPGSHDEVAAVLALCSEAGVAVVPFGGGSSVVGGVEPMRGSRPAAVSLDLARMDRLLAVDRTSLTATFEPGVTGPDAEELLAAEGLTLGHFPQSFEYATLGGFAATRSAGQASTGYGRIDELILGLRAAAPVGELRAHAFPASAAGPALRELLVGSEGALAVITELTLAVRPAPEARRYEGWSFASFAAGAEVFRYLEQNGAAPHVARLSDPAETGLNAAVSGRPVELPHDGGCLAILGWEGAPDEVDARAALVADPMTAGGGKPIGPEAGEAWLRGRYAAPYLRDDLLDLGVMVETLETATSWSRLERLYRAVADALRESLTARGGSPLVMCHVSHLYRSGASLYYTFFDRQERGAELDQWRAAKTAACEAIIASGGTITHHHAVGADHLPWMQAEVGELGVELLRAVKARLDPAGIMNPGKLVP